MLLTISTTHRPATRPRATCCTSTPTGCRVRAVVRRRARASTRRRPTDAAPSRCCSRSTRSARRVAGAQAPDVQRSASTSTTGRTRRPRCSRWRWRRCSRTALDGRCDARPELAGAAIPLRSTCPALPCRGGADARAPAVRAAGLDGRGASRSRSTRRFPSGATRATSTSRLTGTAAARRRAVTTSTCCCRCSTTPSTTGSAPDEVDKLLRAGEGWLAEPPGAGADHRAATSAHAARLVGRRALARLAEADDAVEADRAERRGRTRRAVAARPLAVQRRERGAGGAAGRGRDLACSTSAAARARCSRALLARPGVHARSSASTCRARALRARGAAAAAGPDGRAAARRGRRCCQSSLTYRGRRGCAGFDAAVLMEVIEHLDPPRLPALERAVFGDARPGDRGGDHAERGVQRALRGAAGRDDAAPGPPVRVDPGASSRAWADAGRRRVRLRASSCAADRRRTTRRSVPPTQLAVFTP